MMDDDSCVRRQRAADWFWLDKVFIRRYAQRLKPASVVVYTYLASRADESGDCWPGISTIANETGLAANTVRSAILQLAGLEPAQPRPGDDGPRYVQLILLTPPAIHGLQHQRRRGKVRSYLFTLLDLSTELSTTTLQKLHPSKIEGSISEGTTLQFLKGNYPAIFEGEQDPFDNKIQINKPEDVVVVVDPTIRPVVLTSNNCSPSKIAPSMTEGIQAQLLRAFGGNGGVHRNERSAPLFALPPADLLALLLDATQRPGLAQPEGWVIANIASPRPSRAQAQAAEWLRDAADGDDLVQWLREAQPPRWFAARRAA